jgi:hypothetical protein
MQQSSAHPLLSYAKMELESTEYEVFLHIKGEIYGN